MANLYYKQRRHSKQLFLIATLAFQNGRRVRDEWLYLNLWYGKLLKFMFMRAFMKLTHMFEKYRPNPNVSFLRAEDFLAPLVRR